MEAIKRKTMARASRTELSTKEVRYLGVLSKMQTWLEGQMMRIGIPRREWEASNQEEGKKNTFSGVHLAFKVLLSEKSSKYKLHK